MKIQIFPVYLCLHIYFQLRLSDGLPDPPPLTKRPWLRICSGAERHVLTGAQCAGGYMFSKPFPAGKGGLCVCGNGIWILKTGYCDAEGQTYVLFADGNNCFNIKSGVRWFRYIGHPERAKLNSHYFISSDWDFVEELHKSGPSRLVASPTIWTMAVGDDPENVYLPDELVCFRSDWRPLGDSPGVDGRPLVRVGKSRSPPPLSIAEAHQAQRLSYCPYFAKEEQTEWMYAGGMLSTSRKSGSKFLAEPTLEVHGNCHEKCTNVPPWEDKAYTTTEPPIKVAINKEHLIPDYPYSSEESLGKKLADLEDPKKNTAMENQCRVDSEALQEIDRQTVRMIRAQTSFALKQIQTPAVLMREYKYLQRSREILTKKCPEIPSQFMRSVFRMFRVALSETTDNHPYRETGQDESYERILFDLRTCMSNDTFGGNDENLTAIFNETGCPRTFLHMQYNLNNSEATLTLRNCSSRIPKSLKFDGCKYDLVMELTWKTILFTHYTCSRYFMNYSADISEYYTVMERLFNPNLLMRFYNPGNSYKGMEFVFQMFDLKTILSNFDHCLGCARDISQYRVWLKRPMPLRMCPMTGVANPANAYNFNMMGYMGIPKNPVYIPYKKSGERDFQCYSSWSDGLYTRPRQEVNPSCGLGLHVIGQTATFA